MRRLALLLSVLVSGCDGSEGASPDAAPDGGGPGPDGPPAACNETNTLGRFTVMSEQYGNPVGHFGGRYADAPNHLVLVPETLREGACAFHRAQPFFCDPACTGSDVCGPDATCHPHPQTVAVGQIVVEGTNPTLTLDPQLGNSYYTMELYPDLYAPGDLVTMEASGSAAVEPFTRSVRGVEPLPAPQPLTAREHEPLVITWIPSADPSDARVVVHMDSDHHGVRAYLECEVDDAAGTLTIPAAIIDAIILAGETGIGTYIENAWIARVRRDRQPASLGCAELESRSEHFLSVETVRAP